MQDFLADAYRDWLQGTAKYNCFASYKVMTPAEARVMMYQSGLSSRGVESVIRCFRGKDINFDLLERNPLDVGLRPISSLNNCGPSTISGIKQWAMEVGLALHPDHVAFSRKEKYFTVKT